MRVLHISTTQDGGAAWCARRIYKAIESKGIDSRMLFAFCGEPMPDDIKGDLVKPDSWFGLSYKVIKVLRIAASYIPGHTNSFSFQRRMDRVNRKLPQPLYLHHPLSEYHHLANHPLVKWADVIHLHWVSGFVDYPTFFKGVNKPVVWTLHDHYPAVGVMHNCASKSSVPVPLKEIDDYCRHIKREGISSKKDIYLVAISLQMKSLIESSDVLSGYQPTLIPNGIETRIFKQYEKQEAMSFFNEKVAHSPLLKKESKVFVFSSYNIWNENKGLLRVIEALEQVKCEGKVLIVVGLTKGRALPLASFPIYCTGLIKDTNVLSKIYSSADFYIQASYEESFGQTPLEAMSCGTPVISTPTGISPELMNDFNGVLCHGFDATGLCIAIGNALIKTYDSKKIRQYVQDNYEYCKIAEKYIDLYNHITNKNDNV